MWCRQLRNWRRRGQNRQSLHLSGKILISPLPTTCTTEVRWLPSPTSHRTWPPVATTTVAWFSPILQLLLVGGSFLIKECTIFCCKEKSQLQQRIIWFSVSYQVISDVLFCLKWLKYLKSIVLLSNSENPWFPSYLVLLMRHLHGNSGWWVCVINL